MKRILCSLGVGIVGLLMLSAVALAEDLVPLRPHCAGYGPLPLSPDFCGCTWGEIHFEGQIVHNAEVSLTFGQNITDTLTYIEFADDDPFFDFVGTDLGARRGDIMTVTVSLGGQTIERPFRAIPEADEEQHVPIVIPTQGTWTALNSTGYTRTLAIDGDVVWAGGLQGLQKTNIISAQVQTFEPPWANTSIRDVEVASDGSVWVLSSDEVAEFDGSVWITHTIPITGAFFDLAIDQQSNAIWVGGGQTLQGQVAQFNGTTWSVVESFPALVTALAVGNQGDVWAGTWSEGVFRQGPGEWTNYVLEDGLASDYIYSIQPTDDAVWFGTRPYFAGQGYAGGLSRYDLQATSWTNYTNIHGLPIDELGDVATDDIFSVNVDEHGFAWVGTSQGLYRQVQPHLWLPVETVGSSRIYDIEFADSEPIVSSAENTSLYVLGMTGEAPIVSGFSIEGGSVISNTELLTAAAMADVPDRDGDSIIAWDWYSNVDGPLCTTANTCVYPARDLTLGEHTLSVRVQDGEGMWSTVRSQSISIVEVPEQPPEQEDFSLYLPLTAR